MCRGPTKGATAGKDRFLLGSLESFVGKDGGLPSKESMMRTGAVIFFLLVSVELSLRGLFIHFQVRSSLLLRKLYVTVIHSNSCVFLLN
jgi:hypothetical protein